MKIKEAKKLYLERLKNNQLPYSVAPKSNKNAIVIQDNIGRILHEFPLRRKYGKTTVNAHTMAYQAAYLVHEQMCIKEILTEK